MFTIRFNKHGEADEYKSYSCHSYHVAFSGSGEAEVKMDVLDTGTYHEQVGPDAPYGIAYVTNEASRTIDVIKALPPEIIPEMKLDAG